MRRDLTLQDVRPLIGNLSRTNIYQVQFGGLTPGLLGYLASRNVRSDFIADGAGLMCYEASLPGSSLSQVQSSNFHGVVENFAHTRVFTPITLSFYCDSNYTTLKMLEHWMEYIVSGNGTAGQLYAGNNYNYRLKYPNDAADGYKCNSTSIYKFEGDRENGNVMEYSFIGLYPSNLSSVPVRYGPNNEITRVTCSFSYDRYVAGSIKSYDWVLGNANNQDNSNNTFVDNVLGTVQNIVQSGASSLINNILNQI